MKITPKKAAEKVGGVVAMSRALGRSRGLVSQWGDEVPLQHLKAVSELTGYSIQQLRPDLFIKNEKKHPA